MELWDAYYSDGSLAGFDLIRGEEIPENIYHMVCEAVIQHTDGQYLLMQRDYNKDILPGYWEIGAGGSALKGEEKIQTVLREVQEETGIDEGDLKELYCIVHERHQSIYYGYLLVTSYEKDKIKLQEGETIDYKWVSKEELLEFYDGTQCAPNTKVRLKEFIDSIK